MSQPASPFMRTLQRLRNAFWRRRFARGLIRAAWLALLVPTVVMAGYLWFGWQTLWYRWVLVALGVGLFGLIWAIRPIKLKTLVHRLDKLLEARAQLITAFEVSHSSEALSNPVADQLLQNAVTLSVDARRQIRAFNRGFWLEMNALVAVAAILGGMLFIDALTPNLPSATEIALPAAGQEPDADDLVTPDAQLFPPPFQQPPPLSSEQVQAALDALSEALRDQAITNPAAEAIQQGDLSSAAQSLRRLADQLDKLSEEARQELGESLQEARKNIGGNVPGFTEPLQNGSRALQNDDISGGSEALEALAETLDSLETEPVEAPAAGDEQPADELPQPAEEEGDEGGGDASGGEEGEGDQPLGEEERLGVDAEPLELETESELEESVLQPAELDAQAGEERTSDSPFARQSFNASGDELGADPLTYPWEKRNIIKEYFTPDN